MQEGMEVGRNRDWEGEQMRQVLSEHLCYIRGFAQTEVWPAGAFPPKQEFAALRLTMRPDLGAKEGRLVCRSKTKVVASKMGARDQCRYGPQNLA